MRIDDCELRIAEIDREYQEHRLPPGEIPKRLVELRDLFEVTQNGLAELLCYILETVVGFRQWGGDALFQAATQALRCSRELGNYYYIVRAYNALGAYHGTLGNHLTAFDCFWNARRILLEHKELLTAEQYAYLDEIVQNNIGCCLIYSEEYELALNYLPDGERMDRRMAALQKVNIALCLSKLGQDDRAYQLIKEGERSAEALDTDRALRDSLLIWDYILSYRVGRLDAAAGILRQLDDSALLNVDTVTAEELLKFLLENRQYEAFLRFHERFLRKMAEGENASLQIKAYSYRMAYCEAAEDTAGYRTACMEVGRLTILRDREQAQVRRASMRTYIQVAEKAEQQQEQEKTQELLRRKSEFDELTGLANRYKLSEFCAEAFRRAISGGISLSIEILDVDFFKRVNDNYGHTQGDSCLQQLAAVIQKSISDPERQICARYGGDEFIIVRLGQSDAEILAEMNRLKQAVIDLGIPNALSDIAPIVTVSQGAVNRIPQEGDDLSRFLRAADESLYEAKKISKNTVVLHTDSGS